ncbi:MAG TPA: DUF3341 domain-containing protein [Candidatus Paceibacterota bacterium]|nr:DUF3341 domain-containing protein [Verrucomicrobiota bacterium]HOX03223.1 DUF3341 domain-containing protein [Verrucomicrobiota bacterium]HRZ46137.1 DUF3341 domain-containing protein [Candidatus Paceibacterota bacterium]HRZ93321.1 DUF3341 domain-containing protein [Candidatus Paceibacterota bacterium]
MNAAPVLHGWLAEFATADQVQAAAGRVRQAGYTRWDVFAPWPIRGLDDAMGLRRSPVGWFVFAGGALGLAAGMAMVWFMNQHDYPLAVGGKPMFSTWFALPIAFELAILFGAMAAVLAMLALNRLPRWHHPLLQTPRFARATDDRFFLVIESADPQFAADRTRQFLESLECVHVEAVWEEGPCDT